MMSAIRSEGICLPLRVILFGLLTLVLVATGTAQTPAGRDDDLLDQVKRKSAIAAQKLEADLYASFREAQRLVTSEPGKALETLKGAWNLVLDDTTLSPERREAW